MKTPDGTRMISNGNVEIFRTYFVGHKVIV